MSSSHESVSTDIGGSGQGKESKFKLSAIKAILQFVPDEPSPTWVALLFAVLRFLQIVPLIFLPQFAVYWYNERWFNGLSTFFDYLNYARLARRAGWNTYFTIYWLNCMAVLIFLSFVVFIWLRIVQNKPVPKFIRQAMKLIIKLIFGVMFNSSVDSLIMISECQSTLDGLTMTYFPQTKCFEGVHLISVMFSYLLIIPYTAACLLIIYLNFEPLLRKGFPHHRSNSRPFLFFYLFLILEVVFRTFYRNTTYPFVFASLVLLQTSVLIYFFSYRECFYNSLMDKLHSAFMMGIWWGAILNFLSAVLYLEPVDSFCWFLMGWALLTIYVVIQTSAKEAAFKQHVDEISSVNSLVLHLEYLMDLVFVQGSKNTYELNGYIQYHKKYCLDLTCPLRSENIYKRKNDTISSYEQYTTSKYGEVVNFITHLFNQGLRKYSGHEDLRILYCFYLMEMTKNMQQALEQLALCESDSNLPLDKLYVVERAKKAIYDEVTSSKDNSARDLVLSSTQSLRHRVRFLLQTLASLMMDFWSQLLKINPDLAVLVATSDKIKTNNDELEAIFKDRENGEGIDLDTLRQFASFQETVIMDESRANKIYEVIRSKKSQISALGTEYAAKVSKSDDLSKSSLATVIISGMRDDFCKIVNINSAAGAVFGYTKNELIGRKVEILMSDVYARIHDQFVSRYISSMEGKMINKERTVVALHKSRYLIPVSIYIKSIEDMGMQTLHFCAFFKTEKHTRSVGYILATIEGDILNISAGIKSVLGIDLPDITAESNMNKWFPSLPETIIKFKQSKGAQRILFHKQVPVQTLSQTNVEGAQNADGKPTVNPTIGDLQVVTKEVEMSMTEQTFTNLKKSLYIYKLENVSNTSNQSQGEKQARENAEKRAADGTKPPEASAAASQFLKKPDDLGSNWDGITVNTQGTGFKFKAGNDSLVKIFSFDIIPQDQRYQIMFGNQVNNKTLMKEAFYYAEDNQLGKNEMIQKNLDKRLKRLQEIDVRLMKLRRGVLIPEMDQDNWDRVDDPELEQIVQRTMEQDLKEADEIVEEELRANEIESLISGKRELEKKLIKARTVPTIFWTFIVGIVYAIIAISLTSIEFAVSFSHANKIKEVQSKYMDIGQQVNYIGMLLLDLQLYPLLIDQNRRSDTLNRMNVSVEQARNLKTSMMQTTIYFRNSEEMQNEILIGQTSGSRYRLNELMDQVLGKSILLLAGIRSGSVTQAQLSMNNETYYYVIQNSLSTLIPFLQKTQSEILDTFNFANTDVSWTYWLGGVEIFIAVLLVSYLFWFLKNTTKDLRNSLRVFLEIPDYNLKSYFTQAEYFVLLFIGDDTNHIDDLKTEVNMFRKLEEKGFAKNANIYQRKKKSFVQGKFWNLHSFSFLLILVIFPMIYTVITISTTVSSTSTLSGLIDFSRKLMDRPQNYEKALNYMGMSLVYPNIPVSSQNTLNLFSRVLKELYQSEESFTSTAEQFSDNAFKQTQDQLLRPGGACTFASSADQCNELLQFRSSDISFVFVMNYIKENLRAAFDNNTKLAAQDANSASIRSSSQSMMVTTFQTWQVVGWPTLLKLMQATEQVKMDTIDSTSNYRTILFFLTIAAQLISLLLVWIERQLKNASNMKLVKFVNCLIPTEMIRSHLKVRQQVKHNLEDIIR